MLSRLLHTITLVSRSRDISWKLLTAMCIIPCCMLAQEKHFTESRLAFFEERAFKDASYEEDMKWHSEEDERDFWTDQRNFEKALEENDQQGFEVYIRSKREAYLAHLSVCGPDCSHGDYYQLQAAYYFQYSELMPAREVFIATNGAN